MAGRKWHSTAQIVKKLEDADRRLTAGQNIAQVCQAQQRLTQRYAVRMQDDESALMSRLAELVGESPRRSCCFASPLLRARAGL